MSRRDPDGPLPVRISSFPPGATQSHSFFRQLPTEIPSSQPPYKPTQENVLLGTGYCQEDLATSKFWRRPKATEEKEIQVGMDNTLKALEILSKSPTILQQEWEDGLLRFPAEYLKSSQENNLQPILLEIYARSKWDIQAKLAVAAKIYFLNLAHLPQEGKIRLEHDPVNLKSRMKKYARVLPAMEREIK